MPSSRRARSQSGNAAPDSSKEIITKIATGQKNLTEIFKEPSYEDLKVVLTNWLNRDTEGVQEGTASTGTEAKVSTPTKPAETKSVEDISSAFDDLFKN